jgi:hypothetical protein
LDEKWDWSFLKKMMFLCLPGLAPQDCRFEGKYLLTVCRAPEPTDIQWENLAYSTYEKYRSRILTYTLTIVLLCLCFGLNLLINYFQVYECNLSVLDYMNSQKKLENQIANDSLSSLLSNLGAGLVVVVNSFLATLIRKFAQ